MDFHEAIEQGFRNAPFVEHLGITLAGLGPGWCEARLELQPWHLQQTGVAHAGVIATLADHTAGAAATTQLAPGEYVVSAESRSTCCAARVASGCTAVPKYSSPGRR